MTAKIVARPVKRYITVTKQGDSTQVVRITQNIQKIVVSNSGARGAPGANHPAQLTFSMAGRMPSSPVNVYQYFICPEDMTILPAEIEASAEVAATGTYVLSVIRCSDDATMVTFTWGAGETDPTVAVLIPTLTDGLKFRWEGQPASDATLADVAINMPASRAEI